MLIKIYATAVMLYALFKLLVLVKVTIGEVVDMEFLACKNVSVSFATVNNNGLSKYSPANVFCVIGGMKTVG